MKRNCNKTAGYKRLAMDKPTNKVPRTPLCYYKDTISYFSWYFFHILLTESVLIKCSASQKAISRCSITLRSIFNEFGTLFWNYIKHFYRVGKTDNFYNTRSRNFVKYLRFQRHRVIQREIRHGITLYREAQYHGSIVAPGESDIVDPWCLPTS